MVFTPDLFASRKQDWTTPPTLYEQLNDEFQFDFDPCPTNPTFDGLRIEWGSRNFVNPPYREISAWMQKAVEEYRKRKVVVVLAFARTDTAWWHDYAMLASEIRFIRGRVRFGGAKWN